MDVGMVVMVGKRGWLENSEKRWGTPGRRAEREA